MEQGSPWGMPQWTGDMPYIVLASSMSQIRPFRLSVTLFPFRNHIIVPTEAKSKLFWNMVMLHIKLKLMTHAAIW